MSRDFKQPCPLKRAASAERVRRYRAKMTPEAKAARAVDKRDYDRKSMYGVTVADIEQRLIEQGGGCKICGTPLCISTFGGRSRDRKPHVDHCHTTGKYRGILCHGCNAGLGLFKDSPAALSAAIQYLGDTF